LIWTYGEKQMDFSWGRDGSAPRDSLCLRAMKTSLTQNLASPPTFPARHGDPFDTILLR
jgi:hypothetical protein